MERGVSLFRSIQLGVLLAVMYYAFLFDDGTSLKAETRKIQKNIAEKKQQLKIINEEGQELVEYADLLDSLGSKISGTILNSLKSYSSGNTFAVFLSNEAKQLDLFNVSVSRVVNSKEEKWEVQEVRVSLEGGYHQVMQFITSIQNDAKLIIVQKVGVSLSHSSGRLQANLVIKLYQFSEKSESATRGTQ